MNDKERNKDDSDIDSEENAWTCTRAAVVVDLICHENDPQNHEGRQSHSLVERPIPDSLSIQRQANDVDDVNEERRT